MADQPLRGLRILVAEDHPFVLETLLAMLEGAGAEAVGVANGRDALLRVRTDRFDLFISDIDMPLIDGLDLLAIIKRFPRGADTPVILFSAHADEERVIRAGRLGVAGFLLKSDCNRAALLAKIAEVLAARRGTDRDESASVDAASPGAASPTPPTDASRESLIPEALFALRSYALSTEVLLADLIARIEEHGEIGREFLSIGNAALLASHGTKATTVRELVPRIGLMRARTILTGLTAAWAIRLRGPDPSPSFDWHATTVRCLTGRHHLVKRIEAFLASCPPLGASLRACASRPPPDPLIRATARQLDDASSVLVSPALLRATSDFETDPQGLAPGISRTLRDAELEATRVLGLLRAETLESPAKEHR